MQIREDEKKDGKQRAKQKTSQAEKGRAAWEKKEERSYTACFLLAVSASSASSEFFVFPFTSGSAGYGPPPPP